MAFCPSECAPFGRVRFAQTRPPPPSDSPHPRLSRTRGPEQIDADSRDCTVFGAVDRDCWTVWRANSCQSLNKMGEWNRKRLRIKKIYSKLFDFLRYYFYELPISSFQRAWKQNLLAKLAICLSWSRLKGRSLSYISHSSRMLKNIIFKLFLEANLDLKF